MQFSTTPPAGWTPTPRKRPRRPMVDLDPKLTLQRPTFRRVNQPDGPTRMETWAAVSADGEWKFEREESPGTPWLLIHVPTDRVVGMYGSLPKAREAVARGWAQAKIAA